MVEGQSGILAVSWRQDRDGRGNLTGRPLYEPSKRRLTWENGATATLFSAEEPDRLRGPQSDAVWADELAAWPDANAAWDMAMFGLRLGDRPQAMVSTTPKPIPLIRELLASPTTIVTRASTSANRANLAPTFLTTIVAKYQGTRLGRQELEGELIEDVEGALWTRAMIDAAHKGPDGAPLLKAPDLKRIVVAVDPAASSGEASALTGVVVAGIGRDGRGYVLEDCSGRMSPGDWGKRVIKAYDNHKADRIIAEGNQGGEMVSHTIRTVRPGAPVTVVHAKHGKQARAEPVAALYEQGRVSHVGANFAELEDQLCTWSRDGNEASPDRLDAMVWALTSLMIEETPGANIMEFYQREADKLRAPAPSVEAVIAGYVALRAIGGVSNVSGLSGRSYLVGADRVVRVHPDDVKPLAAIGFERVD